MNTKDCEEFAEAYFVKVSYRFQSESHIEFCIENGSEEKYTEFNYLLILVYQVTAESRGMIHLILKQEYETVQINCAKNFSLLNMKGPQNIQITL